jgi:hypothetical protein
MIEVEWLCSAMRAKRVFGGEILLFAWVAFVKNGIIECGA